jgi:pyruvate/2-oxoglutarate dehydrogenase complex dihydrolipoamide dehydrogenase (E3) component
LNLFAGERKVSVGGDVYTADHVLIAVGGRPR